MAGVFVLLQRLEGKDLSPRDIESAAPTEGRGGSPALLPGLAGRCSAAPAGRQFLFYYFSAHF